MIFKNVRDGRLLSQDSTFFGDLFPHAAQWEGELYARVVRPGPVNRCARQPDCVGSYSSKG